MTDDTRDGGRTRRDLLRVGGGATAVTLAGCSSLLDPDGEEDGTDPEQNESGDVGEGESGDQQPESAFDAAFDPAALYLTWERDPTTTMSVNWHVEPDAGGEALLEYRESGTEDDWTAVEGTTVYDPEEQFHPNENTDYDRAVNRAELTGLEPGTSYSFRFGTAPVWTFRTLPAQLEEPLTFANGGDTEDENWEPILETLMTEDPEFVTIGGDLPYANGGTSTDALELWHSWLDSVKEYLVDPEGRVVPIVVGIGNHECRAQFFDLMRFDPNVSIGEPELNDEGEVKTRPFEGDPAESRRLFAPYFYTFFPFPGGRGYGTLDAGEYLSVVMLDSYHTNSVLGPQTEWLDETLEQRRDVTHVFPHSHVPAFPSHRELKRYTRQIQDAWLPLFERERIRFTFGHHDHTTKITPPLLDGEVDEDGVVEVGDGCMGVSPRDIEPDRQWIEHAESTRCVNIVTIDGETTRVETLGAQAQVLQEREREVREL